MVKFNEVQAQLVALNPRFQFMGISEVRKLARLLEPQEKILECMKGWHKGRATLLCATDKKIIYIDVRSAHKTLPHTDYTDINIIQIQQKSFSSSLHIHTTNGVIDFMLWRKKHAEYLKSSLERHATYVKDADELLGTASRSKSSQDPYRLRNWRTLVKKVGAASIAS